MIPESRRAHRIVAIAEVRAAVALSEYRYYRALWRVNRYDAVRTLAIVARTRWSAYADLLREPLEARVAA